MGHDCHDYIDKILDESEYRNYKIFIANDIFSKMLAYNVNSHCKYIIYITEH